MQMQRRMTKTLKEGKSTKCNAAVDKTIMELWANGKNLEEKITQFKIGKGNQTMAYHSAVFEPFHSHVTLIDRFRDNFDRNFY